MYSYTSGAPKLVPCVDCGHAVSTRAAICPRCRSAAPLGLPCMFCGQPVRGEDLIKTHLLVCHRQCLASHFAIPRAASCPDCGTSLAHLKLPIVGASGVLAEQLHCPGCGCRTPLGGTEMCSFCGQLVYDFQVRVDGRPRRYAPQQFDTKHVLHGFCVETGLASSCFDYPGQRPRGIRGKLSAWAARVLLGEPEDM